MDYQSFHHKEKTRGISATAAKDPRTEGSLQTPKPRQLGKCIPPVPLLWAFSRPQTEQFWTAGSFNTRNMTCCHAGDFLQMTFNLFIYLNMPCRHVLILRTLMHPFLDISFQQAFTVTTSYHKYSLDDLSL